MLILKTQCPKCKCICKKEYTGDLTKDELYYSCKEMMFTCTNCRQGFGPYHFSIPSHKMDIEEVK